MNPLCILPRSPNFPTLLLAFVWKPDCFGVLLLYWNELLTEALSPKQTEFTWQSISSTMRRQIQTQNLPNACSARNCPSRASSTRDARILCTPVWSPQHNGLNMILKMSPKRSRIPPHRRKDERANSVSKLTASTTSNEK
jgi:hypothetical protein